MIKRWAAFVTDYQELTMEVTYTSYFDGYRHNLNEKITAEFRSNSLHDV